MSDGNDDHELREIPALRKRVHRLGLSLNYGIDEASVRAALDRHPTYVFWPSRDGQKMGDTLRDALRRDRERHVIATVPSLAYFPGQVRSSVEKALRTLQTDYVDVFQLGWLGRTSALTGGIADEMQRLKAEGKVRLLGASIHDRPRAGRMAEDSILDMLMIRYNAAHPGAERDIFPHLARRRPLLVAYTATCWGRLLKRPSGWDGAVPTAGQCYRFCLSSPHVDLVLSGPGSAAQHEENLAAVARGPLSPDEMDFMRRFGDRVHQKNRVPFAPS